MRTRPRASSRPLRTLATGVAVTALAAAGTVVTGAAPAQAAACNGYVGLTFDDGPSGTTQSLLNALRQNGLRATMFNQGQYAAQNPALVRAQVDAGMWVANHSYTHPHMTQLGQAQMDSEISRTQQAIAGAGGGTPKLFRPPYGETNATLRSVEAKYGLTEVIWDVDSQDWNNASTDAIVQAVSRLGNGQVILMHDWPANTLAAVPRIAQTLAAKRLGERGRRLDRDDERAVAGEGDVDLERQRDVSQRPDADGQAERQRQHLGRDHPGQRQLDLADRVLQRRLTGRPGRRGPHPWPSSAGAGPVRLTCPASAPPPVPGAGRRPPGPRG